MLKITFFDQNPCIQKRSGWPYYHGDCTLIQCPDGQNVLVDISTKFSGAYLTEELLKLGVERIDHMIFSHLHQDHTAGFVHLADKLPVGEIILSGYGKGNLDAELSLFDVAREKQIPIREVRQGQKFDVGNVMFDVLFPAADAPEAPADGTQSEQGGWLNLYSLVLRMTYGSFSALLTGDIHLEIEDELISTYGSGLRSTLLKIPHHGNDTSTGAPFVEAVNPTVAVVMSTGCEWLVQRKFSSIGTPLYGTFCDGNIIAQTDGTMLKIICDKGERMFQL